MNLIVQGMPFKVVALQVVQAVFELPPGQGIGLHRRPLLKHLSAKTKALALVPDQQAMRRLAAGAQEPFRSAAIVLLAEAPLQEGDVGGSQAAARDRDAAGKLHTPQDVRAQSRDLFCGR